LTYKIIYDYPSYQKQYEVVKLLTPDRNEAIKYFLELYEMKKNNTLKLDPDCFVKLFAEINIYIRGGIELLGYKEGDNLSEMLEKIERRLTTSYENTMYTIKLRSGSEFFPKYKVMLETKNKKEALDKFLELFEQKQRNLFQLENGNDIVLDISISPFDTRCIYMKYLKDQREILFKLNRLEKDLIKAFDS
ncbi:MAG: hypothetical protein Q8920_15075, partial [Bacillota bacterium]|nr:hypothetical protein [Bacillota bacterium]